MKRITLFTCLVALIFSLTPGTGTCGQPTKVENITKWNDIAGPEGQIAFQIAVTRGNVEEVKEYLQQGADPNFIGLASSTMIVYTAVVTGNKDILKMLLKAGTSPNFRNNMGMLPVMKAVLNPEADLEFMKMLLDVTTSLKTDDVEKVKNDLKTAEERKYFPFTPQIVPTEKIKMIREKLSMLENALLQQSRQAQ